MSVYPQSFLEKYDVIEERYTTRKDPDAGKKRNARARELRKEGYQVQIETFPFDTADVYTLTAAKKKEN